MDRLSFSQRAEGWGARVLFGAVSHLPLPWASALGGAIARLIGPRLGITRRARRNLVAALPDLTPEQQTKILRDMWDNLGRVAFEYPHVAKLRVYEAGSPVEIVGLEHLDAAATSSRPVILFSGHLGNWEIGALAVVQRGLSLLQIYRAANNPVVEAAMVDFRKTLGVEAVAKGAKGGRRTAVVIRNGGMIGMLVDQKMNDGIPVPFFGRDAWTAPALAKLAIRYDAIVLPWRVERLNGANFRLLIDPPLEFARGADTPTDVLALMTSVNTILETWIRQTPAQWFWLHRRWPNS